MTFSLLPFLNVLGALGALAMPTAAADLRPWNDYRVIMWVGDSVWKQPDKVPLFVERLREMGVDTAMVYGAGGDARPWLTYRFPFYVENIVNRGLCLKWNSQVTDWDKFVTGWANSGRPESAFVREYCFDDPQWLGWAKDQMRSSAERFGAHMPLAYDIRDELSVTISANPFDYNCSPAARTRIHRFQVGEATLVAVERNVDYHMSEDLKQAGGNEALEKPIELTAQLSHPAADRYIYDLRSRKLIGHGKNWTFTLDPWQPSLFTLFPEPVEPDGALLNLLKRVGIATR